MTHVTCYACHDEDGDDTVIRLVEWRMALCASCRSTISQAIEAAILQCRAKAALLPDPVCPECGGDGWTDHMDADSRCIDYVECPCVKMEPRSA